MWDGRSVMKAGRETSCHGDLAGEPAEAADHSLRRTPIGHKIGQQSRAKLGLEAGFEDQCVGAIIASCAEGRGRRDRPGAIVAIAKQACEYSWGIKARPAKPSERTVSIGERRAGSIANHGVIANGLFRPVCQGADAAKSRISHQLRSTSVERGSAEALYKRLGRDRVAWPRERSRRLDRGKPGDGRARTIPSAAKPALDTLRERKNV